MARRAGNFLFMKKDSQWSTRCRFASGTPALRMPSWSCSASAALVPNGFSAATCTRCWAPLPQLSTAALDHEPNTKGGRLKYSVMRP